MSYSQWGPSYGDPSHPTTGELPKVGDGVRGTDELRTVQVDTVTASRPRVGQDPALSQPRRRDDTTQFARVGNGLRGSVGPVTVQIDHVRIDGGTSGDTQLLPRAMFQRQDEIPPAAQSKQPEPGTGSMPTMRRQMGPDWTQTPLRLLAAAVVAIAVLGLSAASLMTIADWINP